MTAKKITTIVLLAFVAISVAVFIARQAGIVPANLIPFGSSSDSPHHKIIAYYFHGAVRCQTCLNIESYTDEAMKTHFADDLASGKLEWRVINREEPPNEHFVEDYQLYSQALILVDSIPGKPSEWKNLEAIWDYVGDKATFIEYIHTEVGQYLRRL